MSTKDDIAQAIAEAEHVLASNRYYEWWVWDPGTRRRRISLRHIMRDDFTFCGLAVPQLTATRLMSDEVENGSHSEMVCRRCRASAAL